MKRNKLPILGCCLLTTLLGAIGGGIIVAIAALVLPKVMAGVFRKMRMQDCDCDCYSDPDCECCSEEDEETAGDAQAAP